MANEPEMPCTVCRADMGSEDIHMFGKAPVCGNCNSSLGLSELDTSKKDEVLAPLLEISGLEALGPFTALSRELPGEYGWNILALMQTVGADLENHQGRSLLESSTAITGSTVLRNGMGEGEGDPGKLTLMLVLGQVIDLSIMKNIVETMGLRTSNELDELRLIGEHTGILFKMLSSLDTGGDETREKVLSETIRAVL
ncbi:MAG: hypothetical protein ACMUHB_06895 [Thermoplasmatota archaeon]